MTRRAVKRGKMQSMTGTGSGRVVTYKESLEYFSPERSKIILDNNNTHNRPRPGVSTKRYDGDMKANRWGPSADPIKFSEIGAIVPGERTLLGGQSRLHAIVSSGKGQWFPVLYDVPVESQKVDDRVQTRTYAETLTLFHGVSKKQARILEKATRRMLYGSDSRPSASQAEIDEFGTLHQNALNFVVKMFPKYMEDITTAPLLGALARAWYYIDDHTKLERFAACLKGGEEIKKKERAVRKLRDWLISKKYKGGGAQSSEAFRIVQRAIHCFINGRSGRGKYFAAPKYDYFPLPEIDPETGIRYGLTQNTVAVYQKQFGTAKRGKTVHKANGGNGNDSRQEEGQEKEARKALDEDAFHALLYA